MQAGAGQVSDTNIPNVHTDGMVQAIKACEIRTGIKYPIDERPASFTSLSLLLSPTCSLLHVYNLLQWLETSAVKSDA